MNKGALSFSVLHLIFISYVAHIEGLSAPFVLPLVVIFLISNSTASRFPKEYPYASIFGFICSSILFTFTIIWGVCILLFPSSTSVTLIITAVTLLLCAISIKYLHSYFLSLTKENRLIKYAKTLVLASVIIATFFGGIYFFYAEQNKDFTALSVEDLHQLADKGNPKANLLLGKKYKDGDGVPENQSLAEELFLYAAKNGEVEAQYLYASMEGTFQNKDSDPVRVKWGKIAASNGSAKAFEDLAGNYYLRSYFSDNPYGNSMLEREIREGYLNAYIYSSIHNALVPRPNYRYNHDGANIVDAEFVRHKTKRILSTKELKYAQDLSVMLLGKVKNGEVSGNLPEYELKP